MPGRSCRGLAGLLVLLVAGGAAADPARPTFRMGAGLRVVRGAASAPLPLPEVRDDGRRRIESVVWSRDGARVKITYTGCNTDHEVEFTADQLEARLANSAALELHRRKQYAEAAAGFARAAALDPLFDVAFTNQASALALGGKPAEAVAALAPVARRNRFWLRWRLDVDPELAGLGDAPELAALRAKGPGDATVAALKGPHPVALDATGSAIAILGDTGPYQVSGLEERSLVVTDLASGAKLLELPIRLSDDGIDSCERGDCLKRRSRPAVAARTAIADRLLRDLGFSASEVAEGKVNDDGDPRHHVKVTFAEARLGVVASDLVVRVLSGNTVLVEAERPPSRLSWAVLVRGVIVLGWSSSGGEDCYPMYYDDLQFLKLPR